MAVSIRPYVPSDADEMVAAARESVREIEPWMPWCHSNYSLEDAQNWIALTEQGFVDKTMFDFGVFDERGLYAGACGLNQADPINKRANLGCWMRTSASRRGYMTDAVRLLISWAKANTDFQRIEIVVAVENAASLRVAEKAGATREAVLKSRLLLHGRFHDAVMFAFVRGENF